MLLSAIQQTTNEKTNQFVLVCRSNTVKGLVSSKKIEKCPSDFALAKASTSSLVFFQTTLTKVNSQSQSSYDKQCTVLDSFIAAVETYHSGTETIFSHHFVLGKRGNGKSTFTLIALCYAMSHGLKCIVTRLAGEKVAQFGGVHLHCLIPRAVVSNIPGKLNPLSSNRTVIQWNWCSSIFRRPSHRRVGNVESHAMVSTRSNLTFC